MLKLLKIKNIAVIASLELEFGPGLTLLTGETGAGKSILIDALSLILGARASAELIRTGEDHAVVEALIESGEAPAVLEQHGLPVEDDGAVIVRREISASGKGRATVNGALAPVSVLRDLAPHVATIHGQHGPQGLLDPDTHIGVLDLYAGLSDETVAVAAAHRHLRGVESALREIQADRRDGERRREMLEYQVTEIEHACFAPDEEDSLRREKRVQANAGKLAGLSEEAYAILYDAEDAVLPRLGQVYRRLEDLARIDPRFAPFLDVRLSVRAHLEDLAFFLRDYRGTLQVSPGRLDEIESRLALVERMKKKYGATLAEVIGFAATGREELTSLRSPEERERELAAQRDEASATFMGLATALSKKRRAAADQLARRVAAELAELAMARTRFEVSFAAAPAAGAGPTEAATERGIDTVEFLLAPNVGEELRPLARIASGGELSRILLALTSVAAVDARGRTLVFDEVDAGIGGRVAEVVGRKLRKVSADHQVLCVTHLPQIASLADRHYVVTKRERAGRTFTEVQAVDGSDRVEEVARMLGGATITDTARRHAREMVKQGVRP